MKLQSHGFSELCNLFCFLKMSQSTSPTFIGVGVGVCVVNNDN